MNAYYNLNGNSNIHAYSMNDGEITVRFGNGSTYLYTDESTGPVNISKMQQLAVCGQGLNTYINTCVRKNYAKRLQ